jgi:ribonuclease R
MESQITQLLSQPDYAPLNVPELLLALGLPRHQQQALQRALAGLERSGQIARIKGNRYARALDADLIPGRIRINRQGKGFLEADDPKLPTIVIPEFATSTAFNGDHVLVRRDAVRHGHGRGQRPPEEVTGKVIRILERARTQLVGTLQRSKDFLFVIPDDPRIPHDIYVPPARDVGRQPNLGDKVVVELTEWQSRHTNPEGEITEVLGAPDEEGVDMLSVLRQYNLPLHFPKKVLLEARAAGSEIVPGDLAGRTDCRSHQVITIDPDDAKDFDDAICLQAAPNQEWKLWVHIADVSHYVKTGTALDDEARQRGNSTYLVDRVIPMLPEALSNELCSLKSDVDRLTKCVEFLLSAEGRVLRANFYSAVIRSQRRFTYREVLAIIERPANGPIEEMVHDAHRMAQLIRAARMKAGSLELDFPENKIRLDEHGKILRIERVENDVSHQLIEEYMLLANEAVAGRLMALNRPAVYRIHEPPDEKRLQEYRQDVLSHQISCGNLNHRPEVQKLLHKLTGLPIGQALKIGFLKSLMRARYALEPLGHYGLAKTKYTHFTSPIRRYADLMVHRALFERPGTLSGAQSLKQVAAHISDTERNSADAERDSKDVKLFAYLNAQLESGRPQTYPGLVTDVRNFGFFVDVSGLGMSGLVPLSTVTDDFFQFDSNRSQLVGRRTRRVIKLGDRIEVQVAKVDRFKKQVDFRLADSVRTVATHFSQRPLSSRPTPTGREFPETKFVHGTPEPSDTKSSASRPPRETGRSSVRGSWKGRTRHGGRGIPASSAQKPAQGPGRGQDVPRPQPARVATLQRERIQTSSSTRRPFTQGRHRQNNPHRNRPKSRQS